MKLITTISALFVLCTALNADLTLWQKAQEIAQSNWRLVPGKTEHSIKMINDKNQESLVDAQLIITHTLNDEGVIENELFEIKMETENSEEGEKRIQELLDRDMLPKKEGIFFSQDDKNPIIRPLNNNKMINGFNCKAFQFEFTNTSDDRTMTFVGTMWLEADSGAPIYSSSSMKKTPMFVSNIEIEQFYHYEPEINLWFQQEIKTLINIRVLLRRMTNTMNVRYSDHWEYQE